MLEWADSNIWTLFGISVFLIMICGSYMLATSNLIWYLIVIIIGLSVLTFGVTGVCNGVAAEAAAEGKMVQAQAARYTPVSFVLALPIGYLIHRRYNRGRPEGKQ